MSGVRARHSDTSNLEPDTRTRHLRVGTSVTERDTHKSDRTERVEPRSAPSDFIRAMVADDVKTGKYGGRVVTRFPPEPNGFLHIGHAKSICLNFGITEQNEGGICHLRFDDTNPEGEDVKYAEAIQQDVRWLGFDWHDRMFFASDYFEKLYQYAVQLIEDGMAYVDSLSEQEIRAYRGSVTEGGKESPHRGRSVAENMDLFRRMRAGDFEDGAHVLRAKADMTASNMVMRDPVLYRIRHKSHYRTGDDWCIYPLYDFTHCLSDAIENITHSLCTLEFKDSRELYDWVLDAAKIPRPRTEQTEFARLNLDYTVLSKRKLVRLVNEGHVNGWDDPRLPTIAGLRRRGVSPEAIRRFCDLIGVAKVDSRVDIGKLEFCIRDDLNMLVPRVMCVLRPLRLVIVNYPEDHTEEIEAPYYPRDVPKEGSRKIHFSRVLYIERDDFREDPPKDFFRLAPDREVRLRYAYFVKCVDVVKDAETGEVTEVHCTYDPDTSGGGSAPDGRKVKGTLHWVSAGHSLPAEVRLYDRLFDRPDPEESADGEDFTAHLNPNSVVTLRGSRIEPSVADDAPGTRYQFERQGYFCSDPVNSAPGALVFNRTVSLRDTWAKIAAKEPESSGTPKKKHDTHGAKQPTSDAPSAVDNESPEQAAAAAHFAVQGVASDEAKILARDEVLSNIFEDAVTVHSNPAAVARWVVNELRRELKHTAATALPFNGKQLGALVALVDDKTISRTMAKEVFAEMVEGGDEPGDIVERKGLRQVSDTSTLAPIVDRLIADNQTKVSQYRDGKTGLLGFFVGQVMRESGGTANPEVVSELVRSRLSS